MILRKAKRFNLLHLRCIEMHPYESPPPSLRCHSSGGGRTRRYESASKVSFAGRPLGGVGGRCLWRYCPAVRPLLGGQKGNCGAIKICEAIGGKVKAIVVCPQTTIGSGYEPIVVRVQTTTSLRIDRPSILCLFEYKVLIRIG